MSGSTSKPRSNLTHEQIVVLATYLAGGDARYADTEDGRNRRLTLRSEFKMSSAAPETSLHTYAMYEAKLLS